MISIVMPTHKKRPLLYATLASVFSQQEDFEFVVVDASPDRYFKNEYDRLFENCSALKKHKNEKDRLKLIIPQDGQRYPGKMKMLGFRNCVQDNDFVIFLDHDDFLYTDLFKHVRNACVQYPDTEMVTSQYTSMIYDSGYIYRNVKTYAGGTICGKAKIITLGDVWFNFKKEQDLYDNTHPYKATLHPKIMKKQVLRDHRFSFIEDTERMDDFGWSVMSHALTETHIPLPGYVYVAYSKNDPSNSCISSRKVSEKALEIRDICETYEKMLDSLGYIKHRNEYVI